MAPEVTILFVSARGKSVLERWVARVGDTVTYESVEADASDDSFDVVLTLTPDDAAAVHEGTLDVSVGFMRGKIKMAGDFGALLRALPKLRGPLQVA